MCAAPVCGQSLYVDGWMYECMHMEAFEHLHSGQRSYRIRCLEAFKASDSERV